MSKKSIWIAGAEGRLGSALVKLLKKDVDNKVVGTDRDVDITNMDEVEQSATIYRPTVIINCASISDVEYCEQNLVEAFKVNALGARNLAAAARRVNAKIIQLSTDDVFAGKTRSPLTEFDMPTPQTAYGKSKLAAENYVRELCPKHLIVRSSWVYGAASSMAKQDYFTYVDSHGRSNTPFDAPVDVISTPTSANELAQFIQCLIDKTEYGIYHASCEGSCTRHEFAQAILSQMGYDVSLAREVHAEKDGSLVSTLLENLMMKMTEIYTMPQWMDALKDYVELVKKERME